MEQISRQNRWIVQICEVFHPILPEIEALPSFLAWEQKYFAPGKWNATKPNHLTNARSWTKDSLRIRDVESGSDRHAVQQRSEKRLRILSGISTLSFRSNWKRKCDFPRTSQSSSSNLAVISRGSACQASIERSWSFIYNSLATTKQPNTQAINNWSSKTGCVNWKEKLRIPSLLPAAIDMI
jgi:hypothetical protein